MDFIRQLVCFHRKAAGNLTPNAIAIYLYLFMENNDGGWEDWFEASDYWMCQAVGIKRRETIVSALNLLKQKGFIDFQRGTQRNRPSRYQLLPLSNSAKDSGKHSGKHSARHGSKGAPKDSANDGFLPSNQNANAKGKRRWDADTQSMPPTFDAVNEYCLENGLRVSAKKFWNYYEAGEWKDGKGNPVRNWKQKLLAWDAHEPEPPKTRTDENMEAAARAIAFFDREEATRNEQGTRCY